jgi:hypothetical protein
VIQCSENRGGCHSPDKRPLETPVPTGCQRRTEPPGAGNRCPQIMLADVLRRPIDAFFYFFRNES